MSGDEGCKPSCRSITPPVVRELGSDVWGRAVAREWRPAGQRGAGGRWVVWLSRPAGRVGLRALEPRRGGLRPPISSLPPATDSFGRRKCRLWTASRGAGFRGLLGGSGSGRLGGGREVRWPPAPDFQPTGRHRQFWRGGGLPVDNPPAAVGLGSTKAAPPGGRCGLRELPCESGGFGGLRGAVVDGGGGCGGCHVHWRGVRDAARLGLASEGERRLVG